QVGALVSGKETAIGSVMNGLISSYSQLPSMRIKTHKIDRCAMLIDARVEHNLNSRSTYHTENRRPWQIVLVWGDGVRYKANDRYWGGSDVWGKFPARAYRIVHSATGYRI
ncbi:MAG TPA: hypothetical protein P5121_26165, partial [Caldilineaceae bacterium]|nr:hypothetical protein [Caldilineaceae bacterium]